jgi:hypothetical protein
MLTALLVLSAFPTTALAVGTFKLKSAEATEVSGAWHIYVTIELPKAPLTAHQSMKFLFTKTAVFERALIDGHSDPVTTRQGLDNQTPSVESLDVDFADPSGKVFKGTRFDFGLTRARGYEAGEYKVEVRTSDGTKIGNPAQLVLKGENPVVDRRSIAFNAKEKSIKKIDGYDAGTAPPRDDAPVAAVGQSGEVTPSGVATGFVPKEGLEETEEERMKARPRGCGCSVPGQRSPLSALFAFVPILGVGVLSKRRNRARSSAR